MVMHWLQLNRRHRVIDSISFDLQQKRLFYSGILTIQLYIYVLSCSHEKEGVSMDLLRIVDDIIEISQIGIIRSLNVHVTGALIIYEFARQFKYV